MLTVPEAARRTGLSAETIRRWIRSGKLPARKVGTQHLIEERDLAAVAGRARAAEPGVPYVGEPLSPTVPERLAKRIVADPRLLSGKPVVRGTRVSVELVMGWIAAGWTVAELLAEYPTLTDDDVRACAAYAAAAVAREEVFPAGPA